MLSTFLPILMLVIVIILVCLALSLFIPVHMYDILRKKKALEQIFLEILVPKQNDYSIQTAKSMLQALFTIKNNSGKGYMGWREQMSFEIVGDNKEIRIIMSVNKKHVSFLEKLIHANYPDAQIDRVKPYNIWEGAKYSKWKQFKLKSEGFYPLKDVSEGGNDPFNLITSSMSSMGPNDKQAIQILFRPADSVWQKYGKDEIKALTKTEEGKEVSPDKLEKKSLIEKKITQDGYEAIIRVVVVSDEESSANQYLSEISNAFDTFTLPSGNKFSKKDIKNEDTFISNFIYRYFPVFEHVWRRESFVLSVEELSWLVHFPTKQVTTPKMKYLVARRSEAPSQLPDEGLYLGYSEYRGVKRNIYQTTDDRRRHTYIIGQTGSGKTELLKFMALQDIRNGKGIAFIDPHGSAVSDILFRIPKERADDVIYFDAGSEDRPFGMNILEAHSEDEQHMIVNAFIALLYKLYDPKHTGIMGPRLERAIRNVMLTAMAEKGNTLMEVLRLLINPDFAKTKVDLLKDPLVKSYWTEELAKTNDFHKSETLGYFVSKFDRFVTDKLIRNIIGQRTSSFNFREIMDQKKILLVDLAKGKIGEENSTFLGLLFVPRILAAALGRQDIITQSRGQQISEEEMPDFYMYVDEFQNFATPDFAEILSEARKFRLNLIVANQYIGQMLPEIKEAIFGNVGTLISYRVGPDDAPYLEGQMHPPFTKEDLMQNPVGRAVMKLLVRGAPTLPFSMTADWAMMSADKADVERGEAIKRLSALKYGRDLTLVNADITKRMTF